MRDMIKDPKDAKSVRVETEGGQLKLRHLMGGDRFVARME